MKEIDSDSVFESEDDSFQNSEIPKMNQKSCIDAVVDEGWDANFYFAIENEAIRVEPADTYNRFIIYGPFLHVMKYHGPYNLVRKFFVP